MSNIEKLKKSFIDVLGFETEKINDSLSYGNSGWDSVAHMKLIAAIENEFDIMIDTEDVIDLSSFLKAKEIVSKYGVEIES